jgi:hypothetical protein
MMGEPQRQSPTIILTMATVAFGFGIAAVLIVALLTRSVLG